MASTDHHTQKKLPVNGVVSSKDGLAGTYDKLEEQRESLTSSPSAIQMTPRSGHPPHPVNGVPNGSSSTTALTESKHGGLKGTDVVIDVDLTGKASSSSSSSSSNQPSLEELDAEERRENEAHHEQLMKRKRWLGIVSLGELTVFVLFYFGVRWHFNFTELAREDIDHYQFGSSLFDIFFITVFKSLVHYTNLAVLHSDEERSYLLTDFAYWVSFIAFIASICKLVVLDDWTNGSVVFLVMFSLVANIIGIALMTSILPKKNSNDWDPFESEEKEAKAKRAAANAARTAKVMEQLKTMEPGPEKTELEEKEKARQVSDAYLEMTIERTRRISRKNQVIRPRQLWTMLKPYFWPYGWGPRAHVLATWTLVLAAKAVSILSPLYIGVATDILVRQNIVPWGDIATYTMLAALAQALRQGQNAVYLKVKQEAFAQVAEHTFRHLHSLSLQWHLKKQMGNVLRSMDRGIASADTVVSYLFLYLLPSLIEAFVVFIIFYFHFGQPLLSAVIFVHLVLYIVITVQLTIWRKKFRKATNKHDNEFHDKATDSLINYETVKYFGNEDFETSRYIDSVRKYQQYNVSTQLSLAVLNTLQTLTIQLSLMFGLMVTAYQITQYRMSIGDFSAVIAYTMNIFTPLSFLGTIYDMVVQSFVDMQNLSELLAQDPDIKDSPSARPLVLTHEKSGARIEFKNVSFSYGESQSGIHDVTFTVEPGTTTAIVGSTGAGKSTIARLLFRFYEVQGGGIYIDGQNIQNITQKSLRKAIGVVPQDTVMFNDTLLHNIKYGKLDATMEEVEEACRSAQILSFIEAQKSQWETKVGERGLRLSGGEKQRVAIARALLKDPPIVLLDEATSALDSVKEQEIQSALRSLERGRTTLVIAHRLSTIKHAEQIIVLEKGRIVERGTHHELLEIPGGYYARLWNQQASSAFSSAEEAAAAFEASANGTSSRPSTPEESKNSHLYVSGTSSPHPVPSPTSSTAPAPAPVPTPVPITASTFSSPSPTSASPTITSPNTTALPIAKPPGKSKKHNQH